MITVKIIKKSELLEVYEGKNLPLFDEESGNRSVRARKQVDSVITENEIAIKIIQDLDPFAIISLLHLPRNNGNSIIYPKSKIYTKELPDALDAYKPILDRLHPKQWWYDADHGDMYILYPEIIISNTVGRKHVITNLVVKFTLTNHYNLVGSDALWGGRLTFTKREIEKGYIHSHLHTRNYRIDNFCLGGSSSAFYVLLSTMPKFLTPEQFEFFLVQLKAYLSWESLEGVPHITINSLYSTDINSVTSPLDNSVWLSTNLEPHRKAIEVLGEKVLQKLNEKEYDALLIKVGDRYIFGPYSPLVSNKLLQFEREFIAPLLKADGHLMGVSSDYNDVTGVYTTSNTQVDSNGAVPFPFPALDSFLLKLANRFNVTPGVVTTVNLNESTTLQDNNCFVRLRGQALAYLYNYVNMRLLDGFKTKINERNNGSTQSTSSNNATVGVADLMPA